MSKLATIEGIGEAYEAKLNDAGVRSAEDLLEKAATRTGRGNLADSTGISESLILRWVNHVDLARIDGVGPQFAELLEASGVDSVAELAQRNAENLHTKLVEVNAAKNLVNRVPGLSEIERFVSEAKELPKVVSH